MNTFQQYEIESYVAGRLSSRTTVGYQIQEQLHSSRRLARMGAPRIRVVAQFVNNVLGGEKQLVTNELAQNLHTLFPGRIEGLATLRIFAYGLIDTSDPRSKQSFAVQSVELLNAIIADREAYVY